MVGRIFNKATEVIRVVKYEKSYIMTNVPSDKWHCH